MSLDLRRRRLSVLIFGLLYFSAGGLGADCAKEAERGVYFGQRYVEGSVSISKQEPRESIAISNLGPSVRYLRILFKTNHAAKSDQWVIGIRDKDFRLLEVLRSEKFQDSGEVWTRRLYSRKVIFDFIVPPADSSSKIVVSDYIAMRNIEGNRQYYSTQSNEPKWRSLYAEKNEPERRKLGDSVAIISAAWGEQAWSCTGVAIAPTLLLTNWHCGQARLQIGDEMREFREQYWNTDICSSANIDFSWDEDGISRDYSCVRIEAASPELDYAILRITGPDDDILVPAAIEHVRPLAPESIFLIHHPQGEPKVISDKCTIGPDLARESWIGRRKATDFEHRCDTAGGSSGAPVFSHQNSLIGLHHHGFEIDEKTCEIKKRVNRGVWIDEILSDLGKRPNLEKLVAEIEPNVLP